MCQCPLTGFFHFYSLGDYMKAAKYIGVSMPFNGLPSFLQEVTDFMSKDKRCQCPLTGFFHFHKVTFVIEGVEVKECQCPLTGFFHFYPATWEPPVYKGLKGAFSPRFLKMLQKYYISPFFCFYKILHFISTNFQIKLYHVFDKYQDFLLFSINIFYLYNPIIHNPTCKKHIQMGFHYIYNSTLHSYLPLAL